VVTPKLLTFYRLITSIEKTRELATQLQQFWKAMILLLVIIRSNHQL